jgi:hypothetical protein
LIPCTNTVLGKRDLLRTDCEFLHLGRLEDFFRRTWFRFEAMVIELRFDVLTREDTQQQLEQESIPTMLDEVCLFTSRVKDI